MTHPPEESSNNQPRSSVGPSTVVVSSEEFDELEAALSKPAHPTASIRRGAELIKKLYAAPRSSVVTK